MSHTLDINDPAAVAAFISDIATVVDDIAAVAADAISPPSHRRLGRLEHRRLLNESRRAAQQLVSYALKGVKAAAAEKKAVL